MTNQVSDREASRDEVWICSFFVLVGVVVGGVGVSNIPSHPLQGLLALFGGLAVAAFCAYITYDRLRRFAEARETAIWLVILELLWHRD